MEFIGAIIIAHLVGDYLLQSHYMATQKTERWWPAILHGITYTIPFIFITQSPLALFVIGGTHIIIDRFRLAKYVTWAKNQIAPKDFRYSWSEFKNKKAGKIHVEGDILFPKKVTIYEPDYNKINDKNTGFPKSTPAWLSVWLMIVADNTLHLLINIGAVLWL